MMRNGPEEARANIAPRRLAGTRWAQTRDLAPPAAARGGPRTVSRRRRFARPVAFAFYPTLHAAKALYRLGAIEHHRRRFAAAGPGLGFDPITSVLSYEYIEVGRNVSIGAGAYFYGPIKVGDDVMFGPCVHVQAGYHRTDLVGKTIRESGGAELAPIVIGDDVWIAARVTVMKGVTIGRGTVIGTESLVLDDIPPYVIAFGRPCRPMAKRFDDRELEEHLSLIGMSSEETQSIIHARNRSLQAEPPTAVPT
jgi:acetyltransferase-like isoleucine patch superfamily enzyme